MTASQEASLDAWMIKTYLACWKPAAQPADADPYIAWVRLKFKPDGSLLKPPKLVNPPSDPAQKPQARSVLQAVKARQAFTKVFSGGDESGVMLSLPRPGFVRRLICDDRGKCSPRLPSQIFWGPGKLKQAIAIAWPE